MPDKNGRQTAIVIGAGVGGVSTAARLAHAGFQVTVVEKNDFTGGRCSLIHKDGYRFDQGPSLLLLPDLFHRTFEELGTSVAAEGIELRKCEPNYTLHFGDGERFTLSSDLAVMKREIEKWEGKDGFARYLRFLEESHAHYELSVTHVLLKNFTSIASMLRPSFLRHLIALHPFESIWSRASKYFWTERLRRVFTFGSMYMGMSPFDAPGTYSLLQYTELAEGIWYPVGGFWRIIEGLVDIGKRKGVDFRMGISVDQIVLNDDGSRATGVRLSSGETLHADVVVCNADLVYAYNNLLPNRTPYAESLEQRPASCSSISFYWGLSQQVPELSAHNIFLADDYKESFDSIFKKHLIPDQPSFYVNVPSRVDGSAAPSGKDSVVVLVPVGHLVDGSNMKQANGITNGHIESTSNTDIKAASPSHQTGLQPSEHQDWPAMIALARKTILSTIQARTGADIGSLIVTEETNDPITWKEKFNLDRGAILGLSHSFFNVLCFRPSTRARKQGALDAPLAAVAKAVPGGDVIEKVGTLIADAARGSARNIDGLYMVGASSHPGTGVPICLAGGRLVAEQVLEDLSLPVPWRGKETVKAKGKLDQVEHTLVDDQSALLYRVMGWGVVVLLFQALGFAIMDVLRRMGYKI